MAGDNHDVQLRPVASGDLKLPKAIPGERLDPVVIQRTAGCTRLQPPADFRLKCSSNRVMMAA